MKGEPSDLLVTWKNESVCDLKYFWEKILIWINPWSSVPQQNLENNTTIFVSRPSLRRMGPAAVVTSTQEDIWISPVLSFP